MRTYRKKTGFTLIELVVAASLLAVITGSIFSVISISLRARDNSLNAIERNITAREITRIIQNDLNNLLVQPVGNAAALQGRTGQPEKLHLRLWIGSIMNNLTSAGRVDYFVAPDMGNPASMVFVRRVSDSRVSVLVDTLGLNQQEDEESGVLYEVLARGVKGFSLRFFHDGQWMDNFNSADQSDHPDLIELSLTFEDQDTPAWSFKYAFTVLHGALIPPELLEAAP